MIDPTRIVPIVRHPAWAGWTGAASRRLDGLAADSSAPLFGIAIGEGAEARPLTREEILSLGDASSIEARAIANLEARPYTFEDIESTKGFLGMGKKPLAVAVRGPLAPERICSPAFLNAARARLGNPATLAVGIPDRDTIVVRHHDAPHFGTAFDAFATKVVRAQYGAAGDRALCNGTLIVRDGVVTRGSYVRPPEPTPPYAFPSREIADAASRRDGSFPMTPASDLEPVPALAPASGLGLQLLGRHRREHFLEVALDTTSADGLGDPGRAALARMAAAVPGTLVEPVSGVRVIVPAGADVTGLEWSLRHPHVALVVPDKKGKLQFHRGPSTRTATDNLSLSLAELAARG